MKHDRTHAGERRADGRTGRRVLRDRRFDDPIASEFLVDVLKARPGVPGTPHALAQNEHAFVTCEELGVRFANCMGVRQCPYAHRPSDRKYTWSARDSGAGYGELRANATASSTAAWTSFIVRSSSVSSTPASNRRRRTSEMGSCSYHVLSSSRRRIPTSTSSAGPTCPRQRNVLHSRRVGPSPRRARSIAITVAL